MAEYREGSYKKTPGASISMGEAPKSQSNQVNRHEPQAANLNLSTDDQPCIPGKKV